jgi:hypothetical protein
LWRSAFGNCRTRVRFAPFSPFRTARDTKGYTFTSPLKFCIPISWVGQTKGGRNLGDSSRAIRHQILESNLEQLQVKENIMNSFKPIWMTFTTAVLLSLASCNISPPIPDSTQISSDTAEETRAGKTVIRHYDKWGNLTFILHWLDPGEYSDIINYLISIGAEPSPENIDKVYDARH